MKSIKLFYLRNCPYCKRALQYIEDEKRLHPELDAYVPTFYIGERKEHEGGIFREEIEPLLRKALNE